MLLDRQGGWRHESRLLRLSHVSEAARPLDLEDLRQLGLEGQGRHRLSAVTGFLLYLDGAIFQVLEGSEDAVERSLAQFSADARIDETTPLLRERPLFRRFPHWSLGALDLPVETLPGGIFFNAEWREVRRRVRAFGRPGFYRILERFYEVNSRDVGESEPAAAQEPSQRALSG